MLKLKACGKCHGDVYMDADRQGMEVYCLQCGAWRYFKHEELPRLTGDEEPIPAMTAPNRQAA